MCKSRSTIALFTALALLAGSPALLAEPGQGRGRHDDMPPRHAPQEGHAGHARSAQGHRGHDGGRAEPRREVRSAGGMRVDSERVRLVVRDNRDYWNPGRDLPPGVRKNLRRGKPLPPGIARHWLDGHLERSLPYYEGCEWVRVGNDLVLISVSTRLINDVLYDLFR